MQTSHKHVMALAAACLAVVALVLAAKVWREPLPWLDLPSIILPHQTPLAPSSTFYDQATSTVKKAPSGPAVSAVAYLVGNVATGKIYLERNSSTVLPVASMSKLITAFAATESLPQNTLITITPSETDVPPDDSNLQAGERFTVPELLYPLLLDSSNVAAEALASTSNRAKFLELMSSYAWEIGMPSTYFADPSGVNPHNVSTARDFFALAQYLYKSRPDILRLTETREADTGTTTDHGAHQFISIHPFVNDPQFVGGKTGHTPEARDTMLTILNIGGQPIAFIVLSSGNRKADTTLLRSEYLKAVAAK